MFIYVFSSEDRDKLISKGYKLISSNERTNVYAFENDNQLTFGEPGVKFCFSDTLTF